MKRVVVFKTHAKFMKVAVKMVMVILRHSSCSYCCWRPFVSFGGRSPCVVYNFILGDRQQATVVYKAGQKHLHHIRTPKKAFLSVLSQHSCVSNFQKSHVTLYLASCKISCSKVLSNISTIATLVPATDIL